MHNEQSLNAAIAFAEAFIHTYIFICPLEIAFLLCKLSVLFGFSIYRRIPGYSLIRYVIRAIAYIHEFVAIKIQIFFRDT